MGALRDIVEAVEGRLESLGFTATDHVFNFDAVPSSVIDKAFRIETELVAVSESSPDIVNPVDQLTVWIAYKAKRSPRAAWKAGLDDRETIEKDLLTSDVVGALASDPILTAAPGAAAQKYMEDFLVSRLVFNVDYLRDIS